MTKSHSPTKKDSGSLVNLTNIIRMFINLKRNVHQPEFALIAIDHTHPYSTITDSIQRGKFVFPR
jgi:hypothetical protein